MNELELLRQKYSFLRDPALGDAIELIERIMKERDKYRGANNEIIEACSALYVAIHNAVFEFEKAIDKLEKESE